jgi:DNA-binding NarL/FixJ family response regulator
MNPFHRIALVLFSENNESVLLYRQLIRSSSYFNVLATCNTNAELLNSFNKYVVNVVVMVMDRIHTRDLGFIRKLKTRQQHTLLVMVSNDDVHTRGAELISLFKSGVSGYLSSDCTSEEFISKLEQLRFGGVPLSSQASRQIVEYFHVLGGTTVLNKKEVEVLKGISEGKTNRRVASALTLPKDTVKTRVRRIFKKLDVNNKADALTKAKTLKII